MDRCRLQCPLPLQGVAKWYVSQVGGAAGGGVAGVLSDPQQLGQALAWAAARVREVGDRIARQANDAGAAATGTHPHALCMPCTPTTTNHRPHALCYRSMCK